MRPQRLLLRALGPYPGEQIVDFAELGARALFLITGPTGAGKTTVLDALCFALYGATSGLRAAGDLRSNLADAHTRTEVVLDFTLGERRYRIWRALEHMGPGAAAGDPATAAPAAAALWDRTGVAEGAEGRVLADHPAAATAAVTRLLGVGLTQFCQVVLLPQDDFRRLLVAGSDEREGVLHALFHTDRLRAVSEELTRRRLHAERVLAEEQSRRALLLAHADAADPEALAQQAREIHERLKHLESVVRDRDAAFLAADESFRQCEAILQRFRDLDEARARASELEAQRPRLAARKAEWERAERAARLDEAWELVQERQREIERAERREQESTRDTEAARREQERVRRVLAEEMGREMERQEAQEACARLRDKLAMVAELQRARGALAQAQARRDDVEARLGKARAVVLQCRKELTELDAKRSAAQEAMLSMTGLTIKLDDANRRVFQRQTLLKVEKSRELAARTAEIAARQKAEAESRVQADRLAWQQAEARWVQGRAAELARDLKDGQPCPVCGGTDHKAPARAEVGGVTWEQVQIKRAAAEDREAELGLARDRECEARAAAARVAGEAARLAEEMGDRAKQSIEELQQTVRGIQEGLELAGKGRRTFLLIEAGQTEARERQQKAEADAEPLEQERVRVGEECAQLHGVCLALERDLPEALRHVAALEQAIQEAEARAAALRAAYARAQEEAALVGARLSALEAGLAHAREQRRGVEHAAREAEAAFARRRTEAGFENPESFLAARRPAATRALLAQAVTEHEQERSDTDRRVRDGMAATTGQTPPDLERLRAGWEELRRSRDEAVREESSLRGRRDEVVRLLAEIAVIDQRVTELGKRADMIGRLARTAGGDNALRVTFQRFVLGALLDEVCEAAGRRLSGMTHERFVLERTREIAESGRSGGLDLSVVDRHTGDARPVRTLSGGEMFLAALALALGLADVVQRTSGGVRLDAIFIDEGFGALDPEALDLAVRALLELQSGGRMVGVVSHVPELRDWIDARLEVTPGRDGSRARFVFGTS